VKAIPGRSSFRPGDAVVIETRDHLPIYVSVDHAEEAANVINALIARFQLAASRRLERTNFTVRLSSDPIQASATPSPGPRWMSSQAFVSRWFGVLAELDGAGLHDRVVPQLADEVSRPADAGPGVVPEGGDEPASIDGEEQVG